MADFDYKNMYGQNYSYAENFDLEEYIFGEDSCCEESFLPMCGTVYDMFGNTVKTLVDKKRSLGFKSVQWNAKNNQGQPVFAGMYVYTIEVGKYRQTKKMIVLK